MDRLNNIERNGGFPLVAESLEILNINMQILESVIKGLCIPNNFVIRFRDSNYAYYDGKILEIPSSQGADLLNYESGKFRIAQIVNNNYDVTDSGGTTYSNAYTKDELWIDSLSNGQLYTLPWKGVKIYDFSELIDASVWNQCDFISLKQNNSNVATTNATHQVTYNDRELRIRTVFNVNNINNNYELLLEYDCPALNGMGDVITLMSTFNGNNNNVNHFAPAYVVSSNNEITIKIDVPYLHSIGVLNGNFTGQITLNGIISL